MGASDEPFRIVVGVGGASAQHVLAWALKEAAVRDGQVVLVRAVDPLLQRAPYAGAAGSGVDSGRTEAMRVLETVLSCAGARDVPVHYQVVADLPARALVAASARADLLVIGAHSSEDGELVHGATARACLQYASCPVVIVPVPPQLRRVPTARTPAEESVLIPTGVGSSLRQGG